MSPLQEALHRAVHRLSALEHHQVAGSAHVHFLGVGNALRHPLEELAGEDAVVVAADDQCGSAHRGELVPPLPRDDGLTVHPFEHPGRRRERPADERPDQVEEGDRQRERPTDGEGERELARKGDQNQLLPPPRRAHRHFDRRRASERMPHQHRRLVHPQGVQRVFDIGRQRIYIVGSVGPV